MRCPRLAQANGQGHMGRENMIAGCLTADLLPNQTRGCPGLESMLVDVLMELWQAGLEGSRSFCAPSVTLMLSPSLVTLVSAPCGLAARRSPVITWDTKSPWMAESPPTAVVFKLFPGESLKGTQAEEAGADGNSLASKEQPPCYLFFFNF